MFKLCWATPSEDLNNLFKWCVDNDIIINQIIDKCASILLSLKKNTLLFDYCLDN